MKILLTGAGGPAGRALYPQLKNHGVDVVRVDMIPGNGIREVLPALHPDFMSSIHKIIETEEIDAVIPTVQEELTRFAQAGFKVPVLISSALAVETADDKWLTYHVLNRAGIEVPKSSTPEQLTQKTLTWLGDPVISKPRKGRGGRGVTVHETPLIHEMSDLEEGMIIQEFAPGEEFAPNVFIGTTKADDFAVVLKKTELENGLHGNALGVEEVDEPEIAQLAIDAARTVGLSGPVDVDIRRRADGTPVVLELNARFGANSAKAPAILTAALDRLERASAAWDQTGSSADNGAGAN